MRLPRVAVLAAAVGTLAGVPECSIGSCTGDVDVGMHADAIYVAGESPGAFTGTAAYLRSVLCSRDSWLQEEMCWSRCPFALMISAPPQLSGFRVCLRDNLFLEPWHEGQHVDKNHPLINKELELALVTGEKHTGCKPEELDGVNFTGRIALYQRGQCAFVIKAANAANAGAVASLIVNSKIANSLAVNLLTMGGDNGNFPETANHPTFSAAKQHGAVLLATARTETVRGRLVLECETVPPELPPMWDGCPDALVRGHCDWGRTADFRLCTEDCPVKLELTASPGELIFAGNSTGSVCLYNSKLLPRSPENFFSMGQQFQVRLAVLVPGFSRDPDCTDDPDWVDPFSDYSCGDISRFIAQGQINSCEDLQRYTIFDSSWHDFLSRCRVTCPKSVGGVGCGGGTGEGCDAADFDKASGMVLMMEAPRSCLPSQMLEYAQGKGVAGVIILSRQTEDILRLEGSSFLVHIPAHAVRADEVPELEAALRAAEEKGVTVTAAVREGAPAELEPPTPAPTESEETVAMLEGSAEFIWTDEAIAFLVFATLLFMLVIFTVVFERLTAIKLPKRKGAGKFLVPLNFASGVLSLSIIVVVAAVTFVMVYNTGKETTDDALDEGWLAVERTHINAVANVEVLKNLHLALFVNQVEDGIQAILRDGIKQVQKMARLFVLHDGSWEKFDSAVLSMVEQAQLDSDWRPAVRTVEGYFASRRMKTDDRSDAVRPDEHEHISVTRNGTLYSIGVYQYSQGGNLFTHWFPKIAWDPQTNIGRSPGVNVVEWVRALGLTKTQYRWHTSTYAAPVFKDPWFDLTGSRPLSCFCPIFNVHDEYVGAAQMVYGADTLAQSVSSRGYSEQMENNTVLIFTKPHGELVGSNLRNDVADVEAYYEDPGNDRITIPLTLEMMPFVHVNAAGNALLNLLNGSLADLNDSISLEFDQADWYVAQNFLQFDFGFIAGRRPVDFSGNLWRAEVSDGGRIDSEEQVLVLDGRGVLFIYTNLTVDVPRVAEARRLGTALGRSVYSQTEIIGGETERIVYPLWDTYWEELRWRPLFREPVLTHQNSWTLVMWIRPSEEIRNGAELITNSAVDPSVTLYASGVLELTSWSALGCRTKPIPNGVQVGQWTHIVAVLARERYPSTVLLQGGDAQDLMDAQTCSVYVNGRLISAVPLGQRIRRTDHLGGKEDPYTVGRRFRGSIKGLKLFNASVDEGEIQQLMLTGTFKRTAPSRRWYFAARPVSEQNGLNWAVAAMIPRADIMRRIDRNNELQRANQTTRRENTDRKLRQNTVETFLLIVAIAMVSVLTFLCFNFALTRPFTQFADRLLDVAVMKFERVDEDRRKHSMLAEVEAMYSAMIVVVHNLKQYSAYLPQVLLLESERKDGGSPSDGRDTQSATAMTCSSSGASTLGDSMNENPMTGAAKKVRSSRGSRLRQSLTKWSHGGSATSILSSTSRARNNPVHQSLRNRQVAVVTVNMVEFRKAMHDLPAGMVANCHEIYIQDAMDRVMSFRGVVDLFIADRVTASFNAMRDCAKHRSVALTCAWDILAVKDRPGDVTVHPSQCNLTAGIAGGHALCGTLGGVFKRFSVLGPVAVWSTILDRLCVAWGLNCLCDSDIKREGFESWLLRSTLMLSCEKLDRSATHRRNFVYEVRGNFAQSTREDAEEWMYSMAEKERTMARMNPWMRYNEAQAIRWGNKPLSAALQALQAQPAPGEQAAHTETQLRDCMEQELRDAILESLEASPELMGDDDTTPNGAPAERRVDPFRQPIPISEVGMPLPAFAGAYLRCCHPSDPMDGRKEDLRQQADTVQRALSMRRARSRGSATTASRTKSALEGHLAQFANPLHSLHPEEERNVTGTTSSSVPTRSGSSTPGGPSVPQCWEGAAVEQES